MYGLVHRAATADGADKSGLTALTWPVVANFAVDAAMAVALANTLFFAAASGESKSKVALYLLITIAPFAVIAPLIGPALDRLQHGRRVALATSFALRTVLVVVLIANYDGATGSFPSWVLYPCALGMMVLSKSFSVLRSAVTPRVLPPTIDLVRVNSRLTVFGLLGGTMVGGAIAAGAEYLFDLFHMPGALYVIVAVTRGRRGAVDADPEVGRGHRGRGAHHAELPRPQRGVAPPPRAARDVRRAATTVGPQHHHRAVGQLHDQGDGRVPVPLPRVRGQVARRQRLGAAAHPRPDRRGGGDRQLRAATSPARGCKLGHPALLVVRCTIAVTAVALATALTGKLLVAALATLVTSAASAIAKASLDASLQDDLPEESRASAFGRSESLLQLAWVAGGAIGRAGVHRSVGGLHGDLRAADPRPGADGGQLPRRLADPRASAATVRCSPSRRAARAGLAAAVPPE